MGSSNLEAGFIVRRLRPCGTDVDPGFTLEQSAGNGFAVLSGWRKGYRLYARRNGVETLIDAQLVDGATWPCKFDSLKLVTQSTDATLHGSNNEGDDVDLVLAIFQDSRVVANLTTRDGWIRRADVVHVSLQSIAAGATYTVWNDIPIGETSAVPGNGFPGTPWVDRLQNGYDDPILGQSSFVRPMLLKPTWTFATATAAIVNAPEWAIIAYVDRDNPSAGEYVAERGTFFDISATLWSATSTFYSNGNRVGSAGLQHGILWPIRGGRFVIANPTGNPSIGVRGTFGFVGQT